MEIKIADVSDQFFQVYVDEKPICDPQTEFEARKLAYFLINQIVRVKPNTKPQVTLQ